MKKAIGFLDVRLELNGVDVTDIVEPVINREGDRTIIDIKIYCKPMISLIGREIKEASYELYILDHLVSARRQMASVYMADHDEFLTLTGLFEIKGAP